MNIVEGNLLVVEKLKIFIGKELVFKVEVAIK